MKTTPSALTVVVVVLSIVLTVKSQYLQLDCLGKNQCRPTNGQPMWRCCPPSFCCDMYQYQSVYTGSKCIPIKQKDSHHCSMERTLSAAQLAEKRNFVLPKTSTLLSLTHITGDPKYWNRRDSFDEHGLTPSSQYHSWDHPSMATGFLITTQGEVSGS